MAHPTRRRRPSHPPRRGRVVIYRDRSGHYRWRLKAGNGEVIATGESHTEAHKARRSFITMELVVRRGAVMPPPSRARKGRSR